MNYSTTDLAVIIPTRNRPFQVKLHLQSLVEQNCEIGKVIVVASGKDIKDIIAQFENKLPIEYYRSKSGQIIQRNLGISNLNKSTKLVASMDDDTIYSNKNSITEMINFWNSVEPQTAGVGFNIVNSYPIPDSIVHRIFFMSSSVRGKVLRSGVNVSIQNIPNNIKTQWLGGGYTVWRRGILDEYHHENVNTKWAIGEDLRFSYPIGKKYPLYVCANAKVQMDDPRKMSFKEFEYQGYKLNIAGFYFAGSYPEFSTTIYFLSLLIRAIIGLFFIKTWRQKFAIGQLRSIVVFIKSKLGSKVLFEVLND